jgi:hypothetical protein
MVIDSLGLRILNKLLSGITQQIGREINPHVLTIEEFMKRKVNEDHFINQVIDSPRIMIEGNDDEFKTMAQ